MGSTLSQLNSVQLSVSLQRSLVLTARQLDEQAFAVAGVSCNPEPRPREAWAGPATEHSPLYS